MSRGTRVRFHAADNTISGGQVRELGSFTNCQLCVMPPGATGSYVLEVEHVLQPGTYFFSIDNKDECLAGRRMIVTVNED